MRNRTFLFMTDGQQCAANLRQAGQDCLPLCLSSERVAELATRAAILEAAVSPKPGLVCIDGNGAHSDMDYPLFVRSARTLRPYFAEAHALGEALLGNAPQRVFAHLRPLGIGAEQRMPSMTVDDSADRRATFETVFSASS